MDYLCSINSLYIDIQNSCEDQLQCCINKQTVYMPMGLIAIVHVCTGF